MNILKKVYFFWFYNQRTLNYYQLYRWFHTNRFDFRWVYFTSRKGGGLIL